MMNHSLKSNQTATKIWDSEVSAYHLKMCIIVLDQKCIISHDCYVGWLNGAHN
jgi:hypothetical protein